MEIDSTSGDWLNDDQATASLPPQKAKLRPFEKKMKPDDVNEHENLLTHLADSLMLARHPNSLTLLKSARLLLEKNANVIGLKHHDHEPTNRIQANKFTLDDVALPKTYDNERLHQSNKSERGKTDDLFGDRPDDHVFERAARTLKVLYLDDQKRLQNRINLTISEIQAITANPKTINPPKR